MELIVAVYDDWGIGKDGTQPIALSADRKFFREATRGAMVIAGRRTIEDFPGKKPLPGRVNVALSRNQEEIPGFTLCRSPEDALELAEKAERAMVIGGGSVYRQMLPYCDTAYVTRVHTTPESDTFFPNLDEDEQWYLAETLQSGEENGIRYEMLKYKRA
ncbi:MAG: dihydrofolate reductase [Candidatus Faecousia sp.]|nr:dihydrofolate reductase [Clostridiales bacterium]MDY6179857.1 dihydrofolate reductase [Candidatus Faecousia sp.]